MSNEKHLRHILQTTLSHGWTELISKVSNFALFPLFTHIIDKSDFGMFTDLYTWSAFLIIMMTFGLETSFMKYSLDRDEDRSTILFSTTSAMVIFFTAIFTLIMFWGMDIILPLLRYEMFESIIWMVIGIIVLDVWSALPNTRLRKEGRTGYFNFVLLMNTFTNLGMLMFLLLVVPWLNEDGDFGASLFTWYDKSQTVHYIFFANLTASLIRFLLLSSMYLQTKWAVSVSIARKTFHFGGPLMVAGLAGIAVERLDIQMLKYLLPKDVALSEVGIYGAVYKFAMGLVIVNKAFRLGAEKTIFKEFNQVKFNSPEAKEDKAGFSKTIDMLVVVLSITLMMSLSAKIVMEALLADSYEVGMRVIPILLLANVCLALHTHLSYWYKLIEQGSTRYALLITGVGLLSTLILNVALIPSLGYIGAAWSTLVAYSTMLAYNYHLGQRHNPYPYQIHRWFISIGMAFGFGMISWIYSSTLLWPQLLSCMVFFACLWKYWRGWFTSENATETIA